MIWLITTTVFLLGFIMFAIDFHSRNGHPLTFHARVINGEVIGIVLMLLSGWSIVIYLIMKGVTK